MPKKNRSISTTTKSTPTFAGIQRGTISSEFNPDYSTTKRELKRIGVLAGGFFVVLVALSFFIK
jgi:hypothetical protein